VSVATLLAACLLAVVQVFFRYVLNNSLPWPEEVARLGFVWVVFLGMALAIHRDAHLRIDLVDRLSGALSATVSVGFRVVMVAAACAALAHHGLELVSRAMGATPALRIPISYLYGAVPAGAILGLGFPGGRSAQAVAGMGRPAARCRRDTRSISGSSGHSSPSLRNSTRPRCWSSLPYRWSWRAFPSASQWSLRSLRPLPVSRRSCW
jgi:TRAP-type C4-dicarboxylate transport system permease small subunit